MRTNLITHFHCNECGNQLNVEYDKNDSPKKKEFPSEMQTEKEPTGAACRYNEILIEPCKSCIDKHVKPAKKLAQAIRELIIEDDKSED